jgi:hypothetical protein
VAACSTAYTACSVDVTRTGKAFPVESGIARSKPLSSLTDKEADALCQASLRTTLAFFESDATLSFACTVAGALNGIAFETPVHVDKVMCDEARRECLSLPDPEPIAPPDCKTLIAVPPETCSATVGDYEMCLEGTFDMFLNDWRSQTCSEIARRPIEESLRVNVDGPDQVAGCSVVRSQCPNLPWPSVKGAFGRANERSTTLREARAAAK